MNNKKGRLGFIVPSKFFTTDYGKSIRRVLSNPPVVDAIVDFGFDQVFHNATTYTCLLFLDCSGSKSIQVVRSSPEKLQRSKEHKTIVSSDILNQDLWIFQSDTEQALVEKLKKNSVGLLELPAAMSRGSSSGMDKVFCLTEKEGKLFTSDGVCVEIEQELLRQTIHATDFTRYNFRHPSHEWIIFPYSISEAGASLLEERDLIEKYPKAYNYLVSRKSQLLTRKQYRAWYGFSAPRNLQIHDQADIIVPLLANRGLCTLLPKTGSRRCIMASAGFSISLRKIDTPIDPRYVLGFVNSSLLFWRLKKISNKFRGGWITCTKQYFGTLPIRTVDFSDASDKARHDHMVELVERMLLLHKQFSTANTGQDKTMIQRQINATDKQIDRLVYELYDLTDEEISIVEGENL